MPEDLQAPATGQDLAARHGFSSWRGLRRHVEAMRSGDEPPTPFVLAYRAVEDDDRDSLVELLDRFPDIIIQRGTNGNDLLGMATATGDERTVRLLLERGADPALRDNRGKSAADMASEAGHPQTAELLRNYRPLNT